MDAAEILNTLSDQGFNVAIKGEALSIVPASRLSDAMRAEIRAHKPELIALLTQAANDAHTEPESPIERLGRLNRETAASIEDLERQGTESHRKVQAALRDASIRANAERIGNALESSLIEGAEALAKIRPAQSRYPGAQVEREPEPAPAPSLSPSALEIAYAYLRAIGETDLSTGQEFIEGLARDPATLKWLYAEVVRLGLADWPTEENAPVDNLAEFQGKAKAVCSRCQHWTPDRINPPGGLGRCAVAAPASKRVGSLWPGDGVIHCTQFQEVKP